jgi:hypothetical protein
LFLLRDGGLELVRPLQVVRNTPRHIGDLTAEALKGTDPTRHSRPHPHSSVHPVNDRCMQIEVLHPSSSAVIRPLSLAQHTLYAELLEQGVDELFDPDLPENGSILVRGNRAGAASEHA